MIQPKVSIVIPVYNTGRYLQKCVNSVLNQSYANLQVIIVDDGSTDGTSGMCDDFAERDLRIQVIHKTNEGLGYTRNKGLEYAVGEYVTFLDSDDWLDLDHINNLVQAAIQSDSDLIIGSRTKYNEHAKKQYKKVELPIYGNYEGNSVDEIVFPEIVSASPKSRLDLGLPSSACFSLYRTALIKENNIKFPSERYCVSEDFFFNCCCILKSEKITIIKEYGYIYRNNPNSITHTFDAAQVSRVCNFYKEAKKLILPANVTNDTRARVYRRSFAEIRGLLLRLVSSSLDVNEKIGYIKDIISNSDTQEMLNNINCREYRFSIRLFSILVQQKNAFLVYILLTIKKRILNGR